MMVTMTKTKVITVIIAEFMSQIIFSQIIYNYESMRSMRSMRGGIIFRNRGPSLKVHHGQCPTRMTKHDSGRSPPGATCDSAKPPHGKTQGSNDVWREYMKKRL